MKVLDYLLLLRGIWLGGLWICVYLVRPVLDHQGYFPLHGMEVMHWMAGIGIACGLLLASLGLAKSLLNIRQPGSFIVLVMILMDGMYYGLMPWWKLQMMLLHAQAALGVLWMIVAPRQVL
jgi:hypothetical protein